MNKAFGFIGLGNMGGNMAATVSKKGFDVYGFDLSEEAKRLARNNGIKVVNTLDELVGSCDVIILSLPKAEHVEKICLGENSIFPMLKPGMIVIDTTTSTAETSRKIASAYKKINVGFLDAPVSGGPAGAASGVMTMVIGGTETDFAAVSPVLKAMSTTQVLVGDVGAGNIAKIANNLLAAAHLITTSEALSMANKAGVSPEKLLEGINAGSGRSAASQAMFPTWVLNKAYNSGFTMALMRKDVGLAKELIETMNCSAPLSMTVAKLWEESELLLNDSDDFCCIAETTDKKLFGRCV